MPAQRMEKVVPELALPHINMRGTYRFPVERYADRLVASARSLDKTFALPHDDQPPPSRLPNKNGTFEERLPAHLWIASLPGHDEKSTAELIANMGTVGFRTNILSGALSPEHRGGNGDPQDLEHNAPPDGGLHRPERVLVAKPEPPVGAHIVTQRGGYTHHRIYVGAGKVVHYGGLARELRSGPVEEVALARFAIGRSARVAAGVPPKFGLLTDNCEHFCEWCLRGQHRSYQWSGGRARE
jgi:hypothetical protein